MLSYKSIPFEVKEIVDLSGGGWEIAGYASTFGGEPDAYGDVIVKGAFLDSLANRWPKFLYEHYEPIGKTLEIREDDKGLFGRWSIVDTQTGTDAYKLAKGGVLDSLSIGYWAEEYEYRADGVRLLMKIDLPEVSAVAVPANRHAVITDVKSGQARPFEDHTEDVRVAVREWSERIRSGSDLRARDGKAAPLTEARRSAVVAVSGSLRKALDDLDALLSAPPPAETINVGAELRRRRYLGAGVTLERPA